MPEIAVQPVYLIAVTFLGLALVGYVTCLMRFFRVTLTLSAGMAVCLAVLAPADARTGPYWGAAVLWLVIALGIARALHARHGGHRAPTVRKPANSPGRRIVVDGTNVMFWDGEDAELDTLRIVISYLKQREISPIVFLDASSRHHLKDKSLTEKGFARALGVSQRQVCVCPAGSEADVFILKFAKSEGLPILSNDRYGDRSQQAKGIKLVKGVITSGRPILDGL